MQAIDAFETMPEDLDQSKMTERQKELMEEFAKIEHDQEDHEEEGFFKKLFRKTA